MKSTPPPEKKLELSVVIPCLNEEETLPATLATIPRHIPGVEKIEILVIDDEPAIGSAIRRALGHEYEVRVATSAAEALRWVRAGERFDVIFCDLMMPHLTGVAFQAEVAARYPEILPRLAFLTGGAFAPGAETFLATTGHRCLDKPFTRATLLEAISAILG